ncbi:Na(+)/citrate cotransporter-like isoform X2 [Crassostrea virginica]
MFQVYLWHKTKIKMPSRNCLRFLKNLWAIRSLFLVPIAFLLPLKILEDGELESRCAYVLVVMAILWLTEALPIPVTALMPVFLIPMFGVLPGKAVCEAYVNDTSMLFLGGLIVAVAVEEVDLHRRIAIGILSVVGSQPNLLMLGLMLPTWFLSMWISNTAATSMMVPIITAVATQMTELANNQNSQNGGVVNETFDDIEGSETIGDTHVEMTNGNASLQQDTASTSPKDEKQRAGEMKRMSKGFALCVAYAANVGGVATLTGTPPNLILQGQANELYSSRAPDADSGITFAKWMGFGLPLSVIVLILAWIWLQIMFLGSSCFRKQDPAKRRAIKRVIDEEKKKLGSIKFGEILVMIMFGVLALLWIFRDIPGFGGWKVLFREDSKGPYVRDSTSAMLVAVSLFFLPSKLPRVFCWNKYNEKEEKPKYHPILTWKKTVSRIPWGVIVLLGGGFALATATTASGLSKKVGCSLRVLDDLDPMLMNLILSLIIAAATEITSNSATATILMPIMAELAINTGSHPLYLMITAAVACSFAFMLPVATPPNAIVFSTGYIKIPDMALAGLVMNVLAVLVLNLGINTWGKALFELDTLPSIFANSTESSCNSLPVTKAAGLFGNMTTALVQDTTSSFTSDTSPADIITTSLVNLTSEVTSLLTTTASWVDAVEPAK